MYEYKKKQWLLTECLEEMYWLWYRLAYYDKEVQISVWDKKVTVRKTKSKEPQQPITKYFNENLVKWMCSYYKDLEDTYFEWIQNRAKCGKFKEFNESSEKSAWKKLWENPKPVAEKMLEIAASMSYGRIYDLQSYEKEAILQPLREEKQKEEDELQWFSDEEEKQKAELEKARIEEVIKNNPQLEIEAREYVIKWFPKVLWQARETMIRARVAMMAKEFKT